MATIDLGKIKLVWRGTYDGSTAYTVDDVVQHTDGGITSSFICTTNSTGNAPSTGGSVHGSWAYLAKGGVAGTNGTDVGTTITTQGDILYRDGSGLQRLAKPASDMYLKNTSGGVVSWSAVSSDYVKITSTTISSTVSNITIDNIFSADYLNYVLIATNVKSTNQDTYLRFRFLDGSGSALTGSNYRGAFGGFESSGGSGNNNQHSSVGNDASIAELKPAGNLVDNVRGGQNFVMNIPNPVPNATLSCYGTYGNVRNNGNSCGGTFHIYYNSNSASRGVFFDCQSGSLESGTITIYGIKN